jgi:hypothetical protein
MSFHRALDRRCAQPNSAAMLRSQSLLTLARSTVIETRPSAMLVTW